MNQNLPKMSVSVLKLKSLVSTKGDLTKLSSKLVSMIEQPGENSIENLKNFVSEITKFQDKNLDSLNTIRRRIAKKRPELFTTFAPLYHTIQVCGRDQHKAPRHRTGVIANKAIKNKEKIEKPDNQNVFIHTELSDSPQPLEYINRLYSYNRLGFIDKRMLVEIEEKSNKFLLDNAKKILDQISDLRNQLK